MGWTRATHGMATPLNSPHDRCRIGEQQRRTDSPGHVPEVRKLCHDEPPRQLCHSSECPHRVPTCTHNRKRRKCVSARATTTVAAAEFNGFSNQLTRSRSPAQAHSASLTTVKPGLRFLDPLLVRLA